MTRRDDEDMKLYTGASVRPKMKFPGPLTIARKEILEQKVISILILIAVILSTMMTTAVGQAAGVLSAMRRQQAVAIGGDRQATFVQLTEEQAGILENDSRLSYVGRSIPLGSMELNDLLRLDLSEYRENSIKTIPSYTKLAAGRLPGSPMEIALSEDALQFLGFDGKIGDSISLPLSKALRHGINIEDYDYEADFILTGITENNYLGYTSGTILGLVGEGTAREVLPEEYLYYSVDVCVADKKSFQTVINEIGAELNLHELDTYYNYPYLNALGIRYDAQSDGTTLDDDGFSFLVMAGVMVAGLVLSAAGLVIYNILKIAVARRIGQYGTLRAIGAQKGQLYCIVAQEVLILCAAGIPAGMLFGFLAAKGILTAALNQLSPEMFLAQDAAQLQGLVDANRSGKWGYLVMSAGITLLFAFLAAAPAAHFAARVSPVTAMHGATGKHIIRRRKKTRIRNFERYYARLNMRRNRGRTAITVLSLVMSITVFITLQGVLSGISVAHMVSEHLGDYSVVNEYGGFSWEELAGMEADQNVESVAAQQYAVYELDEQYAPVGIGTDFVLSIGERFQIYGYNDCWADYSFADRLTEEQMKMLKAGEGCVIRNPIPMEIEGTMAMTTNIEEGRTITIAGKKLQVLLSLSGYDGYFSVGNGGFINGVQVLVSDRLYPELTGRDHYAEFRPILKADADREAFDQTLDSLASRAAGMTWVSYEETDRQLEESAAQINLLGWGLILFIGLIGILNIINTVYTNIHTRVTEIGTQRAIGMSAGSLYRTFLWEGIYYGMYAALLGSVAGYLCSILVEAAASDTLTFVSVPVTAILEAAVISVVSCLLATAVPLRRISKLSIVEAVDTV